MDNPFFLTEEEQRAIPFAVLERMYAVAKEEAAKLNIRPVVLFGHCFSIGLLYLTEGIELEEAAERRRKEIETI